MSTLFFIYCVLHRMLFDSVPCVLINCIIVSSLGYGGRKEEEKPATLLLSAV